MIINDTNLIPSLIFINPNISKMAMINLYNSDIGRFIPFDIQNPLIQSIISQNNVSLKNKEQIFKLDICI